MVMSGALAVLIMTVVIEAMVGAVHTCPLWELLLVIARDDKGTVIEDNGLTKSAGYG